MISPTIAAPRMFTVPICQNQRTYRLAVSPETGGDGLSETGSRREMIHNQPPLTAAHWSGNEGKAAVKGRLQRLVRWKFRRPAGILAKGDLSAPQSRETLAVVLLSDVTSDITQPSTFLQST